MYDTGNQSARDPQLRDEHADRRAEFPQPGKQLIIDALNFSDMGYDVTGPQVHADGEIWSKTNFDIRNV